MPWGRPVLLFKKQLDLNQLKRGPQTRPQWPWLRWSSGVRAIAL